MRVTSTGFADWLDPVEVHPASFMTPPEMCSDGAGGAYFVWVEKDGDDYDLNVTLIESDGNPATGFPKTISTGSITLPRICPSDEDAAKVAWVEVHDNESSQDYCTIYICEVSSSGSSTPIAVDSTIVSSTDEKKDKYFWGWRQWLGLNLARGSDYTVVTMKYNYSEFESDPQLRTMAREYVYLRLVDDENNVTARDTLYSYDYTNYSHYERPIMRECYSCLGTPVAVASDGGAYLAWEKGNWLGQEGKSMISDIYVVKIDSDGDIDSDYNPPEKISGVGYSFNKAPQIITDGTDALVVWQSMGFEGKSSSLYMRKLTPSGPTGSSSSEVTTGSSSGNSFTFDLLYAGEDEALVVWNQGLSNDWDIYAKKFEF